LLAWCVEEGSFTLNEETWKLAASQGSLNVMTWLWEKNVPWNGGIAWENQDECFFAWIFDLVPTFSRCGEKKKQVF